MKRLFFVFAILSMTAMWSNAQVDAAKTATKVVNAVDELTPGEKLAAADPNITVKTCQYSGKQSFYRKNADGTTTVMQYDTERKALVPVLDKEGKEVTYNAKACAKGGKSCKKGGKACCAKSAKTCSKGGKAHCSKGGKACCKKGGKACCKKGMKGAASPAAPETPSTPDQDGLQNKN